MKSILKILIIIVAFTACKQKTTQPVTATVKQNTTELSNDENAADATLNSILKIIDSCGYKIKLHDDLKTSNHGNYNLNEMALQYTGDMIEESLWSGEKIDLSFLKTISKGHECLFIAREPYSKSGEGNYYARFKFEEWRFENAKQAKKALKSFKKVSNEYFMKTNGYYFIKNNVIYVITPTTAGNWYIIKPVVTALTSKINFDEV